MESCSERRGRRRRVMIFVWIEDIMHRDDRNDMTTRVVYEQ
jgi:hypothetical protein